LPVSENFQCQKSREELSDNAVSAVASGVDLNSFGKMVRASDIAGSVVSDDPCVPLSEVQQSVAVANESDIDFIRLGIVPENLVASLFDDDSSVGGISIEQRPAAEPRKGFVTGDHADANNWFYQDPQGVIQGKYSTFLC